MKIDTRQVAYRPAEQGAADRRNSPLSKKFSKAVCGISVVKRKITPVFTEVISYLVEAGRVELPSESTSTGTSPSAGDHLHSLTQAWVATLLSLVES